MTDENEDIIDKIYRSNWKPVDMNNIEEMKQVAVIEIKTDKEIKYACDHSES